MRIGLCSDDMQWQEKIMAILKAYEEEQEQELSVTVFTDAHSLAAYNGAAVQILFIGINQKEISRIDLGCEVNKKWPFCQIVYIAETLDCVLDVYRSRHLYFVLKDQFENRLAEIMDMAQYQMGQIKKNIILNVHGKEQLIFDPQELLYFEREKRITRIISKRGEFITSEKISSLIERLPSIDFVRCHNSYIVYLPAVDKYVKNIFLMKDGRKILISRGYSSSTRKAVERWKRMRQ